MSLRVFASTQIAMFKNKFSLYTRDAVVTRPVTPGPKKLPQFLVCRYSAHASCPLLYILVELISLDECNCLGASLPFFSWMVSSTHWRSRSFFLVQVRNLSFRSGNGAIYPFIRPYKGVEARIARSVSVFPDPSRHTGVYRGATANRHS